jgi:hypothetical protein
MIKSLDKLDPVIVAKFFSVPSQLFVQTSVFKRTCMKLLPIAALIVPAVLCHPVNAQSPPAIRTLTIAGHPGSARILESGGKSYVALDDLARLVNGSLSFNGNQVVLALTIDPAAATPAAKPGFSRPFMEAGIELMSSIREWRITIVNSIQNNTLVSEEWISRLRRRSEEKLAMASAARSTDDDRSGYPLLAAEVANMKQFSEQFLSKRRQSLAINPNSLDNDSLDQQILACGRSLASMAAEGRFHEEPACTEAQ